MILKVDALHFVGGLMTSLDSFENIPIEAFLMRNL